MLEDSQDKRDRLWSYYQNHDAGSFTASKSRLDFIARRCSKGSVLLNIGTGSGYFESILNKKGVITHSLDPDKATIERLKKEIGLGDRAKQGYCHSIPFPDRYFDIVVMTEVLEHISNDSVNASLAEVRRVLKSSGRLIGTVPYMEVMEKNRVYCPYCNSGFHRWGHVNSFSIERLRDLFQDSGMDVQKLQVRAFSDFSRADVRSLLRSIFRHILGLMGEAIVAPNIYFVCRQYK